MNEPGFQLNKTVANKNEGMVDRLHHTNEYYELKTRIHDRLISLIDLSLIDSLDKEILTESRIIE